MLRLPVRSLASGQGGRLCRQFQLSSWAIQNGGNAVQHVAAEQDTWFICRCRFQNEIHDTFDANRYLVYGEKGDRAASEFDL